jgi:hypothetical protein
VLCMTASNINIIGYCPLDSGPRSAGAVLCSHLPSFVRPVSKKRLVSNMTPKLETTMAFENGFLLSKYHLSLSPICAQRACIFSSCSR